MKRIVVFLVTVLALVCPLFAGGKDFNVENVTKVCYITHEKLDLPEEIEVTENGNQFYYSYEGKKHNEFKKLFTKFDGVNLYYEKGTNIDKLVSKHNISSYYISNAENMKILYGYTSDFSDYRYVDGKKINVQIAWTDYETVVGFPLILTGY